MSTNDVPGAKAVNADVLSLGCWAEHEDGSLIFVASTEGGRIIYSLFDISKTPILEYRDAMTDKGFKDQFSWKPSDPASVKWTWHDKTPFPWDRVIEAGAEDGVRIASAIETLSAAARVAEDLSLRAQEFQASSVDHLRDRTEKRVRPFMERLSRAMNELRP